MANISQGLTSRFNDFKNDGNTTDYYYAVFGGIIIRSAVNAIR